MNPLAVEFIPSSLKSVWEVSHAIINIPIPERASFLDDLEPDEIQFPSTDLSQESLNNIPASVGQYEKFLDLIYLEYQGQKEAFKCFTIYDVMPYRTYKDYLAFIIPGLADASPMINEGDAVILN